MTAKQHTDPNMASTYPATSRLSLRWHLSVGLLAGVSIAAPTNAQEPGWEPSFDPTLNCSDLPLRSASPLTLGLPAALAAAERRELHLGALGYTLLWAEREADPVHIPVLKRIVEEHRCSSGDVGLAMIAIEAAGEPADYFVDYVRDWERDDRVAQEAMNALAIRGDSLAFDALADIADTFPTAGRFGRDLYNSFRMYRGGGITAWRWLNHAPITVQVGLAAAGSLAQTGNGVIIRSTSGADSLSLLENERIGYGGRIPLRLLRRLARAYPSHVAAALVVYEDTLRANLTRVGVPSSKHDLFVTTARPQTSATAFPTSYSLPSAAPPGTALAPAVCVEDRGGQYGYGPDDLAAVFSYGAPPGLLPADPVRVPYGPANALTGPWDPAAPLRPVPPEVFFPAAEPDAPGRPFRVAFRPGDRVSWTLLGQTVTASSATPLCGAPPPR